MNQFKELGIEPSTPGLSGDKIKIQKVLNREIVVSEYRIEASKFEEGTKCLYLQICLNNISYVIFTGSIVLMDMIERVPKDKFPFSTIIIQEGERYQFT